MADCAILRESGGYMVRILRAVVIALVTRHTRLIQSRIDSTLMTACTCKRRVTAGQRELRSGRMIENRTLPRRRVVTVCTCLGELRALVIRIHRRCVIALVARRAFLRSPLVNAVFMAICTGKLCVTAG